jgi:hypothetical protein
MFGLMKMLGGMFVLGRIAASNMSASQALAQMHPGIAHFQALFAALAAGLYLPNLSQVCAGSL